jgi:Family of unknown function (DUF6368)
MGGPACLLWIPSGTRGAADLAVERMVELIAVPAPWVSPRNFNTHDTRPIGGREYASAPPPYCSPDPHRDEGDELQIHDLFGFWPEPEPFAIGVCCNGEDDHRVLADIAAHLAEETGGVIDFGSALPAAAELPGRTATICRNGWPGYQPRTFLDGTAMRAWSRRPDCWMLK